MSRAQLPRPRRLPSATPVRGLLRCLDASFFIPSFEEEGYAELGHLRQDSEDVVSEFVQALSMPGSAGEQLLGFAFRELRADEDRGGERSSGLQGDADPGAEPASQLACCAGAMDAKWLEAVLPLYAQHMGCENMGPLLYSLVRFLKPTSCLEVGAGYTTAFILQALQDSSSEARLWARWADAVGTAKRDAWLAPTPALDAADAAVLHCVDNLAHSGTTAHRALDVAERLGLAERLRLHLDDAGAWLRESEAEVPAFDFVWLDGLLDFAQPSSGGRAGIGAAIDSFLSLLWPRVAAGGFVLLHSTLTNSTVRKWLDGVEGAPWGPPGAALSLLEPHKRFQNSVTLLQRRPVGFREPIYSALP